MQVYTCDFIQFVIKAVFIGKVVTRIAHYCVDTVLKSLKCLVAKFDCSYRVIPSPVDLIFALKLAFSREFSLC